MSLVTKYSESPIRLMENQKLVEIQFPDNATDIIGLKTDNLSKIDVTKCSKDFVSKVKSSYQDKTNSKGDNIKVIEQPNNEIWYTASSKLTETTSTGSKSGLHTTGFGVTITSHTFEDGKGVIVFNGNVTTIGQYAFYGCSKISSITLPDSTTSIGNRAFQYCSGLTSITIPDGVTTIGQSTFYGCYSLTSVTIPNSVTSIDVGAFQQCTGLKSISIPNSVTSIGGNAFYECM